jgi:hypothetical protein
VPAPDQEGKALIYSGLSGVVARGLEPRTSCM